MIITGSTSNFSLTDRDQLQGPATQNGTTSLDASYLNKIADAIYTVEHWSQNTILAAGINNSALSIVVQNWLVTYPTGNYLTQDPRHNRIKLILPISSAFLEDAGLISIQTISPTVPAVSLAQSIPVVTPHYIVKQSESITALATSPPTTPQPPWVTAITRIPFCSTGVRLRGATCQHIFCLDNVQYYDAGDGVSPIMQADLIYSSPIGYGTPVPFSTPGIYEISLLVMNPTT